MANDSDPEAINVSHESDLQELGTEDYSSDPEKVSKDIPVKPMSKKLEPLFLELSLPPVVKKRIKALKKLQLETFKLEAKFYEEVHLLESKYNAMYSCNYEKRNKIIVGEYEPSAEECEWPLDDDVKNDLSEELEKKLKLKEAVNESGDNCTTENLDDIKGVPDFWLTILKNVDLLSDMVQPCDEPILKHLTDIKLQYINDPDSLGFIITFHFSPNEYFTNDVLQKTYLLKCNPDEADPFSFEGPEIYKCKGCDINWNKGKNVTLKLIQKKQKHKSRGSMRTVVKTVKNDSFFNFFSPPTVPDDPGADVDEDTQELLTTDFEVGHFIRERIIPRAVLFFTGEALEDDDEDEDEDYEDETDDDDEDDTDEDVRQGSFKDKKLLEGADKNECKQQ